MTESEQVNVVPDLNTWIFGVPEPSEVVEPDMLCDPNDGRPVQQSRSSSQAQLERAIAAATATHAAGKWLALGVAGRAEQLDRFAEALVPHLEAMARLDALNSGVPIGITRAFAGALPDTIRHAAALAVKRGDWRELPADPGPVRLHRVPWGPTALIVPWNAPATLMVKKMAFALAAGAPVVVKPSPASPWSAQLIAEAAAATLPEGVVGVILGGAEIGSRLCSDPRIKAIAMTGSTATGQTIARQSAPNLTRLRLELGSVNPVIVRHDADVAATAESLFQGMTKLNGQWCEAPRVVLAHRAVHRDLDDALATLIRAARPGSSLSPDTSIGPQAFEQRQAELVGQTEALVASGGRIVAAAEIPEEGWFFGPTLVSGAAADLPGEVFGPLLRSEAVESDEQALRRSHDIGGGLAGYVFGRDVDSALQLGQYMGAGEIKVNGTSLLDMSPQSQQSFFGLSGIGGHGDSDFLDFFTGSRVVGRDLVAPPL